MKAATEAEKKAVYTKSMAHARGAADAAAEKAAGSPYCELTPPDLPSAAHRDSWLSGYRKAHGRAPAVRS